MIDWFSVITYSDNTIDQILWIMLGIFMRSLLFLIYILYNWCTLLNADITHWSTKASRSIQESCSLMNSTTTKNASIFLWISIWWLVYCLFDEPLFAATQRVIPTFHLFPVKFIQNAHIINNVSIFFAHEFMPIWCWLFPGLSSQCIFMELYLPMTSGICDWPTGRASDE